jgi:chromosome segregation ATPase
MNGVPSVGLEPALTFTLSQDEEAEEMNYRSYDNNEISSVTAEFDVKSPKVQKIAQYIFTEEEMIAHGVNQIKMIAAKEAEIAKLQRVHEELKETKLVLEQTQQELEDKDKELQETYQELSTLENELTETKMDLYDTKQKLNSVSSTLMQCQHKLHETTTSFWPW